MSQNLEYTNGLSLTGRAQIRYSDVQPEWQEEALYTNIEGPLDAPTWIAAGGMWNASNEKYPTLCCQILVMIDRRLT